MNQLQKTRQQHGATCEHVVQSLIDASSIIGLGALRKRPSAVIVRQGKPIYTKVAGVDFTGHLRGGKAVYLEAKFTTKQHFAFAMIRDSQRSELDRATIDGCMTAVVILMGHAPNVAQVFVVPWRVIQDVERTGTKSLNRDELQAWKLSALQPLLSANAFKVESNGTSN